MFTALKANRGKQEGKKKMSHTLTCAGKHVYTQPSNCVGRVCKWPDTYIKHIRTQAWVTMSMYHTHT